MALETLALLVIGLFIIGIIIVVAIKAFIAFLPSILAAFVVWLLTDSLLFAAIAFIGVAILAGGWWRAVRRPYY